MLRSLSVLREEKGTERHATPPAWLMPAGFCPYCSAIVCLASLSGKCRVLYFYFKLLAI